MNIHRYVRYSWIILFFITTVILAFDTLRIVNNAPIHATGDETTFLREYHEGWKNSFALIMPNSGSAPFMLITRILEYWEINPLIGFRLVSLASGMACIMLGIWFVAYLYRQTGLIKEKTTFDGYYYIVVSTLALSWWHAITSVPYLYRGINDYLMFLWILLACVFLVLGLERKNRNLFIITGLALGFALATRLIAIFYILAVIIVGGIFWRQLKLSGAFTLIFATIVGFLIFQATPLIKEGQVKFINKMANANYTLSEQDYVTLKLKENGEIGSALQAWGFKERASAAQIKLFFETNPEELKPQDRLDLFMILPSTAVIKNFFGNLLDVTYIFVRSGGLLAFLGFGLLVFLLARSIVGESHITSLPHKTFIIFGIVSITVILVISTVIWHWIEVRWLLLPVMYLQLVGVLGVFMFFSRVAVGLFGIHLFSILLAKAVI